MTENKTERKHIRNPVNYTATVRAGALVFKARVINLSMGDAGLLVPTRVAVAENDLISIELCDQAGEAILTRTFKQVILAAKVKRVTPDPNSGPEAISIGVIFPTYTPALMSLIS